MLVRKRLLPVECGFIWLFINKIIYRGIGIIRQPARGIMSDLNSKNHKRQRASLLLLFVKVKNSIKKALICTDDKPRYFIINGIACVLT